MYCLVWPHRNRVPPLTNTSLYKPDTVIPLQPWHNQIPVIFVPPPPATMLWICASASAHSAAEGTTLPPYCAEKTASLLAPSSICFYLSACLDLRRKGRTSTNVKQDERTVAEPCAATESSVRAMLPLICYSALVSFIFGALDRCH